MRLGLTSDIHRSAGALDIAPERMGGQVEEMPSAGDATFQSRSPNQVIRTAAGDRQPRCSTSPYEYIYSEPAHRESGGLGADYVVYGHTHDEQPARAGNTQ